MNKPIYPVAFPEGVRINSGLVAYPAVTEWLNRGDYDQNHDNGMRLACAVLDGIALTWFTTTPDIHAAVWRWVVAAAFVSEQRENNQFIRLIGEDGREIKDAVYNGKHGAMTIHDSAQRISLASHVEGYALQKYGQDVGMSLAIQYYQTMVDWCGDTYRLSDSGRDVMADLLDNLLAVIHSSGVPALPTEH